MPMTLPPPSVAGMTLDRWVHACALFSSRDEEYAALVPFIRDSIANRERLIVLGADDELSTHRDHMASRGVDVAEAERGGYLNLVDWDASYLLEGRFDVARMLRMVDSLCGQSVQVGYPRGRFIGHMEWALLDRPGTEGVIEFECLVNDVLERHGHPAICVYDVTKFDAATIVDILRTHPIVIMNGVAQENPFFLPPAEFIASRRGAAGPMAVATA